MCMCMCVCVGITQHAHGLGANPCFHGCHYLTTATASNSPLIMPCISKDKTSNVELLNQGAPGKDVVSNWFQKSRLQIDPLAHMANPPSC